MEQAAGNKMKILILGGTGFISSSIARKFLLRGHEVTLFNRGKHHADLPDSSKLHYFTGDRDNENSLRKAASSDIFDVVYDMIAYTPDQAEKAVKAFKGETGRFIFCSTASVYMVSDKVDIPVTEDQDKRPIMEFFPRNPFGMQYGIDKRKCEDVIWKSYDKENFPVTVVRPIFVSGPRDPAKRDFFWIQRIADGGPLLVPGTGNYRFQEIYIEDCSEIFCRTVETDISIGEAYNAAAEETFTLNEYLAQLSRLLNKEPELYYLDQEKFDKLDISYSPNGDVFTFNTRRDAVLSLDKVKQHLNYKSTPFKDWMNKTVQWFFNSGIKSVGYENRQEELKIIKSIK